MRTILLVVVVSLLVGTCGCRTVQFHVSPSGDDANPGTEARPFATPPAAQRAVRRLVAAGLKENVTVVIAEGTYYLGEGLVFGPEDSGTKRFGITWRAARDDVAPRLIGGRRITGFRRHKGNVHVARLPHGARPKLAIENGRLLVAARDPNEGYYRVEAAGKDGTVTWRGKQFMQLAGHDVSEGMINIWPGHQWFNHVRPLKAVEPAKRRLVIDAGWRRGGPMRKGNRFYLANLLPLLDAPGECAVSLKQGLLYVRARKGPVEKQTYAVATAQSVLAVRGRAGRVVRNLHFRGLDLNLANGDAVRIEGAEDCSLRACRIENAGNRGVCLWRANRRITVADCEIRNTGHTGVYAEGAEWKGPDISSHHVIANNHVHHCGVIRHDGSGIQLRQAGHSRIVHNRVHNVPRYGISLKGMGLRSIGDPDVRKRRFELLHARNNLIAYNHVHHVCQDSMDAGGIESWGPGRDNVFDHNLVHDVGTPELLLECGIYLDDSSNYSTVTNNIVYNVAGSGHVQAMFVKGIHNRIDNNVLIAGRHCGAAIRTKSSGEAADHRYTHNIIVFENDFGAIYQFDDYDDKRITVSDNNVYFKPRGDLRIAGRTPYRGPFKLWQRTYDKHSLTVDPKFVNPAERDYRLRADSPALKLGIKSIDTGRIGLTDAFPKRLSRK